MDWTLKRSSQTCCHTETYCPTDSILATYWRILYLKHWQGAENESKDGTGLQAGRHTNITDKSPGNASDKTARPLLRALNVCPSGKVRNIKTTAALCFSRQVNPPAPWRSASARLDWTQHAQFRPWTDEIYGLLSSTRTGPPHAQFSPVAFGASGFCKVATSFPFHTLIKPQTTCRAVRKANLTSCVTARLILEPARGLTQNVRTPIWQYICYVIRSKSLHAFFPATEKHKNVRAR